VHEDAQGRLYFALPIDTLEFELVGRPRSPKAPGTGLPFPGRYRVTVVSGQ
jgi:hypothetical protein